MLPQSPEKLRRHITEHLDTLPGWAKRSISDLLEHAGHIENRLLEYDRAITRIAREDARSKRLTQLRGIGPTTASALLASIGAGHDFRNGRQVAAWIGLTAGQYSGGFSRWVRTLVERRGCWRGAIAIAAKNARLAWASLKNGEDFRLEPSAELNQPASTIPGAIRTGIPEAPQAARNARVYESPRKLLRYAPIESFWGSLKNELIYHQRFATREQARLAIGEYIESSTVGSARRRVN